MLKRFYISLIAIAIAAIGLFLFIGWSFSIKSFIYEGKFTDDSVVEKQVTIRVVRRNIDMLFSKLHGKAYVYSDDQSIDYVYTLTGTFREPTGGYYALGIMRVGNYGAESYGMYYFDKDEENLVIDTNNEKIFAASEQFLNLIPAINFS